MFITGAGGFIGQALVEALLYRGDRVRCLVKDNIDVENLRNLPVEIAWGDVRNKRSLVEAVKGREIVYHLAALINPFRIIHHSRELPALYYQINVAGTKNLIEACFNTGIKKFIYFSSVSAVGFGAVLHEDSPCNPTTDYGKSKLEAENLLLQYFKEKKFPAIIIRPGSVYGPKDMFWLTVFRLVKKGIVPFVGKGYNSTPVCYISNLVKATLLIEEKSELGEVYFVVDDPCALNEFVQTIADAMQAHMLRLYLPRRAVFAAAYLKEAIEKILHLRFYPFGMDFGISAVRRASSNWVCSNEKIKKKIGYIPDFNLRQAIFNSFQWYKEEDLL